MLIKERWWESVTVSLNSPWAAAVSVTAGEEAAVLLAIVLSGDLKDAQQ